MPPPPPYRAATLPRSRALPCSKSVAVEARGFRAGAEAFAPLALRAALAAAMAHAARARSVPGGGRGARAPRWLGNLGIRLAYLSPDEYYERLWLRNAFKSQLHRSEFQTLVHRGPHQNLRPHGRNIPDKRSREGRNVLLHSHEREQPTLPRVDPVAYKDQNEIASRLTY